MTTPDTLTNPTVVAGIAAALEFLEGSDDPRADVVLTVMPLVRRF